MIVHTRPNEYGHCWVRGGWEQRLSCLVDECRSLCRPVGRVLGVRRVPVSAGGDHLGGALVSAFRALLMRASELAVGQTRVW